MKAIALMSVACLLAVRLPAKEPVPTRQPETILAESPAAELPAVAAALVKKSSPQTQEAALTNIVTAAVRLNPAAAPAIAGAVARAVPAGAHLVAEAAARQEPGQIGAIARAIVGVAPLRARAIVVALCTVAPAEYQLIAIEAAEAAPRMGRDILQAVGSVTPVLRPYLDKELAAHSRSAPPVAHCLEQAQFARSAALGQRPGPQAPQVKAPNDLPPKPPRGRGHPPGGRNYARP